MAISHPSDRTTNFPKEIKSRIRELAFSLDVKQATRSESPLGEVNQSCGKREADCPLELLDDSDVKKHKENQCIVEEDRFLEDVTEEENDQHCISCQDLGLVLS
ncbi:las1-like family protein [Artemisia annua]|uniref:Las1-like family protein n=1 Tax=Artemisia annua TaxID=35608 RepID=A0A2U1L6D8_ARTAN|nr:las1-like family protein [Artemisia annua]